MLISRFFDGLAGSAFLSVAGGSIGDMFDRDSLQAPMMIYTASPFIGPGTNQVKKILKIAKFLSRSRTDLRRTHQLQCLLAVVLLRAADLVGRHARFRHFSSPRNASR